MTSLVVSIVAICISIASLTWQFAVFRLSGPRLKAELLGGNWSRQRMITRPLAKGDDGRLAKEAEEFAEQGHGDPILVVRGFNGGRLAVQVLRIGAELGNGTRITPVAPFGTKTPLPCMLVPHEEGMWAVPLPEVRAAIAATRKVFPGADVSVRVFVEVAGGEYVYSRRINLG